MPDKSVTDYAAWIGAFAGVGALVWDVIKWKTSGPKLEVRARAGMEIHPAQRRTHADHQRSFIVVRIANNGDKATTVQCLAFAVYASKADRRTTFSSQRLAAIRTSPPLPCTLSPGSEWSTQVERTEQLKEMLDTGKCWCEVSHSASKKLITVPVSIG